MEQYPGNQTGHRRDHSPTRGGGSNRGRRGGRARNHSRQNDDYRGSQAEIGMGYHPQHYQSFGAQHYQGFGPQVYSGQPHISHEVNPYEYGDMTRSRHEQGIQEDNRHVENRFEFQDSHHIHSAEHGYIKLSWEQYDQICSQLYNLRREVAALSEQISRSNISPIERQEPIEASAESNGSRSETSRISEIPVLPIQVKNTSVKKTRRGTFPNAEAPLRSSFTGNHKSSWDVRMQESCSSGESKASPQSKLGLDLVDQRLKAKSSYLTTSFGWSEAADHSVNLGLSEKENEKYSMRPNSVDNEILDATNSAETFCTETISRETVLKETVPKDNLLRESIRLEVASKLPSLPNSKRKKTKRSKANKQKALAESTGQPDAKNNPVEQKTVRRSTKTEVAEVTEATQPPAAGNSDCVSKLTTSTESSECEELPLDNIEATTEVFKTCDPEVCIVNEDPKNFQFNPRAIDFKLGENAETEAFGSTECVAECLHDDNVQKPNNDNDTGSNNSKDHAQGKSVLPGDEAYNTNVLKQAYVGSETSPNSMPMEEWQLPRTASPTPPPSTAPSATAADAVMNTTPEMPGSATASKNVDPRTEKKWADYSDEDTDSSGVQKIKAPMPIGSDGGDHQENGSSSSTDEHMPCDGDEIILEEANEKSDDAKLKHLTSEDGAIELSTEKPPQKDNPTCTKEKDAVATKDQELETETVLATCSKPLSWANIVSKALLVPKSAITPTAGSLVPKSACQNDLRSNKELRSNPKGFESPLTTEIHDSGFINGARKFYLDNIPHTVTYEMLSSHIHSGILDDLYVSGLSPEYRARDATKKSQVNRDPNVWFGYITFYKTEDARKFYNFIRTGNNSSVSPPEKGNPRDHVGYIHLAGSKTPVFLRKVVQRPLNSDVKRAVEKNGATRCLLLTFRKNGSVQNKSASGSSSRVPTQSKSWTWTDWKKAFEGDGKVALEHIKTAMKHVWGDKNPLYIQQLKIVQDPLHYARRVKDNVSRPSSSDGETFYVLLTCLRISTADKIKSVLDDSQEYKPYCSIRFSKDPCETPFPVISKENISELNNDPSVSTPSERSVMPSSGDSTVEKPSPSSFLSATPAQPPPGTNVRSHSASPPPSSKNVWDDMEWKKRILFGSSN